MTESLPAAGAPVQPAGVVLALTGTPADEPGLRTALTEARRRRAPLHLLWPCPPAARPLRTATRRAEARYLERVRAAAVAARPGVPVSTSLTVVAPGRALVEASRTAELLVLRPFAPTGWAPHDVVPYVTCHAWCPVLLDRSRTDGSPTDGHGLRGAPGAAAEDTGGVVAGVDEKTLASRLPDAAAEEAAHRDTHLLLVHARPARTPAGMGARLQPRTGSDAGGDDALDDRMAEAVAGLRARHPGVAVDARVVEGSAGGALAALSRGADLLVVGRPHRSLPLPRTTGTVVDRAFCPVLVLPLLPARTTARDTAAAGAELPS